MIIMESKPTGSGHCYEYAFREFINHPKNRVLVHGLVNGQGPLEGVKYGHAWIIDEYNECVIDKTQPSGQQKIPLGLYYWIGKIDPSETVEYDLKSALTNATETGHYGPWDPMFENYP